MKNILLILALLHQTVFAQNNCDVAIRKLLRQPETTNSTKPIPILVQGNPDKIKTLTEAANGLFKYAAGNISSINLPANAIANFAGNPAVIRMESRSPRMQLLNDTMRVNNNINAIQQGLPPLAQPFDGSGILCGFIDAGIDFNHPDFKDSNGNTRVAWLWDHKKPVGANTPAAFGYGQEWDRTAINAGQCTQNTALAYGHGSFSAGITAGNGLATGFNQGCAPKADLLVVNYDFDASPGIPNAIADGINYMFTKADALGKPCVINLSLGDLYGSFDGKDLEAQAIDNMLHAKPGRLIVAAAGNWGGQKAHLSYQVNADTNWTWFKYDPAFGQLYIELYGDSADMVNLNFALGADANTTAASFLGSTAFTKVTQIPLSGTYKTIAGLPGDTVFYDVDKFNGVYALYINIITQNPTYFWRLMTTGSGTFGLRNYLFTAGLPSGMVSDNLPSASIVPNIIHYRLPDSLASLSNSFNCLDDVVSVGNYVNMNSNYDCQNVLRFNPVSPVGDLAPNSSVGPTRDGRQKPDISATGNYTMAPLPMVFVNDVAWQQLPKMNAGCYHYVAGGTSAAAPVVAGIGALYLQKNPTATAAQFRQHIICAAKQDSITGTALPNYRWGYGKADGFKTLINCVNGINEVDIPHTVYPNPFSHATTLTLHGALNTQTITVQIADVMGKVVALIKQQALGGDVNTITIKRNGLSAGIYFYKAMQSNKILAHGKLVLQ